MNGRLLAGRPVPSGMVAAVGGRETGWAYGECAYVVFVGATGPVRVHYALTDPVGPAWLRLVVVSDRRRRRVLGRLLRSGALEGAGPRGARAGLGTGHRGGAGTGVGTGAGTGADASAGVSPFGWLHVAAGDRSVWTDLPSDGRVGGIAVRDLVVGLVPGRVWEELHARRAEAWDAWARACGSVPLPGLPGPDRTRPDSGGSGGGFDAEATRREAVDQGPWDTPVAGRRADQGPGWPGIRHGGGMGGAW
ncbi:hypothetical protein [Actinomadura geliboluensis]|uniref:hypothetical protein n=1 Tax=Actinomadura geliboluensis TaxID=882440 RepID=UPI002613EAC0|nr:hypothetical protein [Actinomadura geliboluensis]